jgi:ABC-type polysaccharide/polyol phosphate transport system ATPase subunit
VTATEASTEARRPHEPSAAPPAVSVAQASKTFRLPHQAYSTLKERVLHPFTPRTYDELHALDDVSFDVAPGEFFGIVGRNGSGKSTLLKCLAGIYSVDHGAVAVNGRLSPFIELGVGFNPELSARDNVIINATMLGLSRREARARFDDIIAFAELEEFVDLKLKNYSSGMSVRLGFAVAVQVDAEVLLVDEVLAVGDASFQQKCFNEFDRLKAQGRTILFVTHDMASVERFCDRGIVLERGEIIDAGPPDKITRTYSEVNFGSLGDEAGSHGPVQILAAWCEDDDGERRLSARQGERVIACVEVEFADTVQNPGFRVVFRNQVRHTIFTCGTHGVDTGEFRAGTRAVIRFSFENRLAPSRYTLSPSVRAHRGDHVHEARGDDISALIVEAERMSGGVVDLPFEIDIER